MSANSRRDPRYDDVRDRAVWKWLGASGLIVFIFVFILLPVRQMEPRPNNRCRDNLKLIALALHEYHERYGSLPPPNLADANGTPIHSWRVLILPFLDEAPLYRRYRFDQPWDGPENSKLLAEMPMPYRCPNHDREDIDTWATIYVAPVGNGTVFPPNGTVRFDDVTDGMGSVLMVVEDSRVAVPWMSPLDVTPEDYITHMKALSGAVANDHGHTGGQHALFVDGSVRFIRGDLDPALLRKLLMVSDGEPVGEF